MNRFYLLILIIMLNSCAFIVRPEGDVYSLPTDNIVKSTLLISHAEPSFAHSIDGYCVYKNGACSGIHYRIWKNKTYKITTPDVVWRCVKK